MKSVCSQLSKAADEGLLADKAILKDTLESVARNFHVSKKDQRYKGSTKLFFEVIKHWGGPRLANFVATYPVLGYTASRDSGNITT